MGEFVTTVLLTSRTQIKLLENKVARKQTPSSCKISASRNDMTHSVHKLDIYNVENNRCDFSELRTVLFTVI